MQKEELKKLQVTEVDNISKEVLDFLAEKYTNNPAFRIQDDRESRAINRKEGYFLISTASANIRKLDSIEFTFIWIGNHLWQYTYLNVHCMQQSNWEDPVSILNKLLE